MLFLNQCYKSVIQNFTEYCKWNQENIHQTGMIIISLCRFSAAFRNEKPDQAINALIRKTAKVVSSPSCLALDLSTPQRDHVTEKWHAHKERLNRYYNSK